MFTVEDHGSIMLVRPLTKDVRNWLVNNCGGGWDGEVQWFGGALVVEPRYVVDIVTALIAEGYAAQ